MKVSALCGSGYMEIRMEAEKVTENLYSHLFETAFENNEQQILNNSLLINLGLIKVNAFFYLVILFIENINLKNFQAEDKKYKIGWNLDGCFKALEKICQKDYFYSHTRETLKLFLDKPIKPSRKEEIDPFQESKESLKAVLEQIKNKT